MSGKERWWGKIWPQQANGCEVMTMIAEHGPPTYQMCLPGSQTPLADIWDANHWVQLRRQQRFEQLFDSSNQTSKLVPSATQGYAPQSDPAE